MRPRGTERTVWYMPTLERTGHADPAAVWRALSDVEAWPQILPTVTAVERSTDDHGLAVGARFRVRQPRLRTAEYVVTQCVPGGSFTWESCAPGILTEAEHHVVRGTDGACAVRLTLQWSGPFAFVPALVYRRLTLRYLALEASTMLRVAESSTTSRRTP